MKNFSQYYLTENSFRNKDEGITVTEYAPGIWKREVMERAGDHSHCISYYNSLDSAHDGSNNGLHRLDGPAFQNLTSGFTSWWVNGKRHRADGPAKISKTPSGREKEEYWLDDNEYTKDEFLSMIKLNKPEDRNVMKDLLNI